MDKPIILWGGVDVDAAYYGENPSKFAETYNKSRDKKEFALLEEAILQKRPVIGICRGAQILCIKNGGKLIQHSVPLKQNHVIRTAENQNIFDAPGCHHQIMVPKGDFRVLAVNPTITQVWYDDAEPDVELDMPEVIYWPKYRHFAIQPHPEWANRGGDFVSWIDHWLKELKIDYSFNTRMI